ncbi:MULTISPECIES: YhdT family protein [Salimicrobium]|uniref:Sodium:pantothenate symporter n=1 Tax=Salimicrobium humidisoli TaxID=2029857 RepID=A0ABX4HR18_9BACI|nr:MULTISPECIES: YhdT family protein [Salimicrobium]PBB05656.1 sodium:pantothenate symporter [Salimicrobium humidisoli]
MDKHDERFKVANREALIGVGLALINFLWWFGFAYGLGSKPPEEYSYIFGLPAWFFMSCVGGFILMSVLVIFVVNVYFTDVPLEAKDEDIE